MSDFKSGLIRFLVATLAIWVMFEGVKSLVDGSQYTFSLVGFIQSVIAGGIVQWNYLDAHRDQGHDD